MLDMRRRAFITFLGGAATAWPLAGFAQQPGKLPTIGYLGPGGREADRQRVDAFINRLRELGWIEGRNVAIEQRWADNHAERFFEIADNLVQRKVDVIVTTGSVVPAVKRATSAIPIIFAVDADPVGRGLVASLARPAAISQVCRCSQLSWLASVWSFCERSRRVCADWECSPTTAFRARCRRRPQFKQRPMHWALHQSLWRSDARKISLISLKDSKPGSTHSMSAATRL